MKAAVRHGVALGLVVGAAFALVETALVFATGWLPRQDLALVFGFDVALFALVGLASGLAAAVLRRDEEGASSLRSLLVAIAPVVALGVRSSRDAATFHRTAAIPALIATLAALLLARALLRRRGQTGSLAFLLAASLLAQTVVAVATTIVLAERAPKARRGFVGLVFGATALAVVALVRLLASAPRPLAVLAAVAACGLGTAELTRGTGRPSALETRREGRAAAGLEDAPSVLLVVLDTVRADRLSCYGYPKPTTPNLDALARRAVLFERAYASSPYSLASHASLLTGLMPAAHGAHFWPAPGREDGKGRDNPLRREVPTLAERLRDLGYRTAGIVANPAYLTPWTGLARGFEHYDSGAWRNFGYFPLLHPVALRLHPSLHARMTDIRRPSEGMIDEAIRLMGADASRPFFLFLNFLEAHAPYDPDPKFERAFLDPGLPVGRRLPPELLSAAGLSESDLRRLGGLYDADLAGLDARLGRLLDRAAAHGRVLVIVTSDHGELLGEHGLVGHGRVIYEEAIRVPLLASLPGQSKPVRASGRVGLHQVAGLVLSVVERGAGPDEVVRETALPEPVVLAEHWNSPRTLETTPGRAAAPYQRAVFSGPHKLIQKLGGADELYELERDPGESRDLFVHEPRRAEALRAAILERIPPPPALERRPATRPDPDSERALKGLGYIR